MKLWRTRVYYADGCAVHWAPSKRAAIAARRELRANLTYADGKPADVSAPAPVDVPTDKAGLVVWLNSNLNTDNG